MTRYKNTAPHLLNRRRSWGQGSHVFAGRLRPKTDHSGTPQSQEQRYRQDGIVNIDTAEPYDLLITLSRVIKKELMAQWKRRPPPKWRTSRLNTLLGR